MEDLCHSRINSFSIQSGIFFYIPIYRVYYALLCHDFKVNIKVEKAIFKMIKSIKSLNANKNERLKTRFIWYFGLFPDTVFKVWKPVYALFTC